MAKKVAEVVEEQPEVKTAEVVAEAPKVNETPKEADAPTIKEAKAVTSIKKVQVHLNEDIDCTVGKVRYTGRKDKDIVVPTDVAAILVNAKVAYRN